MAWDEQIRKSLGDRLAAARKLAGFTLQSVADRLTKLGRKTSKAAVGAWEDGRNVPDSLVLRRLAKLYGVSADALLWDDAISIEAIRFAAQYDALDDKQQRAFKAMWMAYFAEAAPDARVAQTIKPHAEGNTAPDPFDDEPHVATVHEPEAGYLVEREKPHPPKSPGPAGRKPRHA